MTDPRVERLLWEEATKDVRLSYQEVEELYAALSQFAVKIWQMAASRK